MLEVRLQAFDQPDESPYLRKAQAYALLKSRGHKLPRIEEYSWT